MKKISNEPNELERTHVIGVSFSSYQFVAFFAGLTGCNARRGVSQNNLSVLFETADERRFDLIWRRKQMI
jgi:hypothetical protein